MADPVTDPAAEHDAWYGERGRAPAEALREGSTCVCFGRRRTSRAVLKPALTVRYGRALARRPASSTARCRTGYAPAGPRHALHRGGQRALRGPFGAANAAQDARGAGGTTLEPGGRERGRLSRRDGGVSLPLPPPPWPGRWRLSPRSGPLTRVEANMRFPLPASSTSGPRAVAGGPVWVEHNWESHRRLSAAGDLAPHSPNRCARTRTAPGARNRGPGQGEHSGSPAPAGTRTPGNPGGA